MCCEFIQILVRIMIFGTSEKFASFLISEDWQGATEFGAIFGGSALQGDPEIEVLPIGSCSTAHLKHGAIQCRVTLPSLWEHLQNHTGTFHTDSVHYPAITSCVGRIPHALLSKLISSPSSTCYSTFFSTGSKNGWLKLKLCWKQGQNSWFKAGLRSVSISSRDKCCTAQTPQFMLHLSISYLIRLLWHMRTLQVWKYHEVCVSIGLKHLCLKYQYFNNSAFWIPSLQRLSGVSVLRFLALWECFTFSIAKCFTKA